MRKKGLIFLIAMCALLSQTVHAECDYKTQNEISTAAANVVGTYEMERVKEDYEGNPHPEVSDEIANTLNSGYYFAEHFNVKIYNITDQIYFRITNEEEHIDEEYHARDLVNGSFSLRVPDTQKIRTYTIKIFSDVSGCSNEELREIKVLTPMYNELADQALCENKDAYYCEKYVTTNIEVDEEKIQNEYVNSNNNYFKGAEELASKNRIYWYIGGTVLIVIMMIAIIVQIKRNKKRKI